MTGPVIVGAAYDLKHLFVLHCVVVVRVFNLYAESLICWLGFVCCSLGTWTYSQGSLLFNVFLWWYHVVVWVPSVL